MFYSLFHSNEKKIIGRYPQLVSTNYSPAIGRAMRFGELPDLDPEFQIEFHKNSKRTDLINKSPLSDGILISSKLKQELSKFSLPSHKFYPVRVKGSEFVIGEYFWLRYYDNIFKYLDFERTVFSWFNNIDFTTISEFSVKSRDEFKTLLEQQTWDKRIMPVKIVFNDEFPNYDLFSLDIITSLDIISERLANQLSKASITGYVLREYDIIESSK